MHAIDRLKAFASLAGSHEKAAVQLGISRSFLTELINETKQPGRKAMVKIDAQSNGQIPAESWFKKRGGGH